MIEKQALKEAFLNEINFQLNLLFDTDEKSILTHEHEKGIAYLMPSLDAHCAYTWDGFKERKEVAAFAGRELANYLLKKAINKSVAN